jgi:hypothetical protein
MRGGLRLLLAGGVWFLVGPPVTHGVALRREKGEQTCLDLQAKANLKLTEALGNAHPANTLAALPRGDQKLGGVKFEIGNRLIQLQGSAVPHAEGTKRFPAKVEGIPVGRTFAKLSVLHAAGSPVGVKEDAVIGKYIVHYRDKSRATIPIVYGKDVRDWWQLSDGRKVTRAKVAWEGANPVHKGSGTTVRLFLSAWVNPHPKRDVARIDCVCTPGSRAFLFCVAMTVEGK